MSHSVTLATNPENPALDTILVKNLRSAWGGGPVNWLSANKAVEFVVTGKPDGFWDHWKSLQALGVDCVIQPTEGRKKQMLLADMDSTMIQQECIDELAAKAGLGEQVAAITARAMNGEIDFENALRERVGLLKGLKTSEIDTVLRDNITLMPGGRTLVATMKAHGAYTALVSGGFTDFAASVADDLGFQEYRANELLAKEGVLTGKVSHPILGRDAKVVALNDIAEKQGLTPDQVMAVGDGANDLGMLQLAGAGVALHAKPGVAAQCDIRINHGDLTALLYIQGYHRNEFVG